MADISFPPGNYTQKTGGGGVDPLQYPIFVGVRKTVQNIPGSAFTKVQLDDVALDTRNGFLNSSWVCPVTGIYEVNGKIRYSDGVLADQSFGLGMDTALMDGPSFLWSSTVMAMPINRQGLLNSRIMRLVAGDVLSLYTWVQNAASISAAELSGYRIQ